MAYKVSIDAGHSNITGGKRTPNMTENVYINGKLVREKGKPIHEFEFNSLVAKALGNALQRHGIQVKYVNDMTGKTDTPLATRASRANEWGSDIHISCHYNAVGSCASFQTKAHGLLVLKTEGCSSKSTTLANKVHEAIKNNYDHTYGVGVDTKWSGFRLAILRRTNMPAILIEFGFMDYKPEALKMLNPSWYNKLGEDVCKGICNYFGISYKPSTSTPTTSTTTPTTSAVGVYKVTVDELNIRQGPGTSYPVKGVVHKGDAYTITQLSGSWGHLKSNAGWININPKYCTKIR